MTSRIEKIKEIIEANKASAVSPLDILNPNTEWVDDNLYNERYSLCLSCPELINLTKQCKKCGCFMTVKSKMKIATCPLGKW
jgi:hypothetical protein